MKNEHEFSIDNLAKGKTSKDGAWHIQKTYNLKKGGKLQVSKPVFTELSDLPEDIANAIRSGQLEVQASE